MLRNERGRLNSVHDLPQKSKLYNHWKASLVGHSDSNGAEDTKITVSYSNNYFSGVNSRTPSFRFGHGHIWNNYFENVSLFLFQA